MTDSYRSEDYDAFPEPVVRDTGVAGEPETVQHRSYDADEIIKAGATFRDNVQTTVPDAAEVNLK